MEALRVLWVLLLRLQMYYVLDSIVRSVACNSGPILDYYRYVMCDTFALSAKLISLDFFLSEHMYFT